MQQLKDLHLIHLTKSLTRSQGSSLKFALPQMQGVFHLDTCQRWIWVTTDLELARKLLDILETNTCEQPTFYHGREAYLFLLRLATGLESKILGETDIFGQLKEAWKKASPSYEGDLNSWFQKVFEDTKEIRTSYLQNLGGSSYGTLVRKMIKDQNLIPGEPVLLVGAGQLAHSIVSFLEDYELWLWNRTPGHLSSLNEKLSARSRKGFKFLTQDEEESAWKNAAQIVVCIPMDAALDQKRIEWLRQGKGDDRLVIHLGGMRADSSLWSELPRFFALDDLFAIQSTQDQHRISQITRAEKACEERATLRGYGMSLSTAHCWEDLSCFA